MKCINEIFSLYFKTKRFLVVCCKINALQQSYILSFLLHSELIQIAVKKRLYNLAGEHLSYKDSIQNYFI